MVKLLYQQKVNGLQLVVCFQIVFNSIIYLFIYSGEEFFTEVTKVLGKNLSIIAEDVGYLTQDVFDLRDKFNIAGMRILQFGFSYWPDDMYLPHNYIQHSIAYTGTHDNNTTSINND